MITESIENKSGGLQRYLSLPSALALSVGFAVGWGAFIMPGISFLPKAGPLGTIIGIGIGTVSMAVFALNYHRLSLRVPGPGGSYSYAQKTFGEDHGFIVGWYVFLAYISILWANGTAIKLLTRFLFGGALQFGFHYTVAGFDVYFGEALLSVLFIASAGFICMYAKRFAVRLNLVLATVMFAFVVMLFCLAIGRHTGGFAAIGPNFSPFGGSSVAQVLIVVAMMPWAFVGFEAVTNSEAEFRFNTKRTLTILLAAVVISALMYAMLAVLPAIAVPHGYENWVGCVSAVPKLEGIHAVPVFCAARKILGDAGIVVVATAMLAGMITGLIGAFTATSRLMYAMAKDNMLSQWFGRLDACGTPRNAIVFIMAVSTVVPFVGRTVIGWPVDVASIGVAIAFGYTSAAAVKTYGDGGICKILSGKVVGVLGTVMAVFFGLLLLVPNYFSATTLRAESYLVLAIWSIFGFFHYKRVYRTGLNGRIGNSPVVWISLFMVIIFTTLMWSRQASMDSVRDIGVRLANDASARAIFEESANVIDREFLTTALVEMMLLVFTLFIIMRLFKTMHLRELRAISEKVRLEKVNKAKSYFFSTVSHDIRTPLNAIIGFSQMLKEGFRSAEEREQAVDSILVSGKTLLSLVNDVLDLSKLESGKMEILPEPTECQTLLTEIAESFRFSAQNPNVEVRAVVKDTPPLMLDPQRMRQIAFNLMGNAVKFTEKGYVEVRASFAGKPGETAGTFRLEVADTGCGISEKDQRLIAMPYVQVGAHGTRHGGTGLGLAICRQLAAAMGGEMTFQSTLGKGSVFSVVIPNVKIAEAVEATPAAMGENPAPAKIKARRILLVDDQKINLMVLKSMLLRISDFDLEMAENGKKALEMLLDPEKASFDLVLTDLWMPEMGGEELVAAIRSTPMLKDLPVYVITADVESQKNYAQAGFSGILLKPVTLERLKAFLA